ncbi:MULTISPECIES: helix-turn-helix domain-containing protein [Jannaschia]|uniref:AraC family transcriptional regulator n=1 Tax=Jannaschia TaxID=188905 RepID=UPI001C7CD28A|nr:MULTISPECIES: helix-turn-helix transcriptional regulator [unclassified Jannaschia]
MGQSSHLRSSGTTVAPLLHRAEAIVSIQKTYADGHVSARHSHDRHQVIYATTGLMMAETETASWAVPAGYGLLMPAGTGHGTRFVGKVRLQSLYVRPEALSSVFDTCRIVSVGPLLAQLIAAFCAIAPGAEPARAHHLSSLILMELAAASTSALTLPYPRDGGLRRVCDALMAQPAQAPHIDRWADDIGLSRRAFTRNFRDQTGLSFGQWSQRLRAQRALQALAAGQPKAAVAHDLGYGSASALNAMMRRLMPEAL